MTPAQNTVAYIQGFEDGKRTAKAEFAKILSEEPPQSKELEQEPVAWAENDGDGNVLWNRDSCFSDDPEWLDNPMPLYTTPYVATPRPQRPSRSDIKPLTDEMAVAAARVLSDRQAAACNVDCGDMWKMHGNDFLEDARAALEAAHSIKENA